MKMEMQTGLLFGTGTFVAFVCYSYWGTDNPVYAVIYAAIAAAVIGFVGFQIGKIMAHPKGHLKPKAKKRKNEAVELPKTSEIPITGEETLLDELTPNASE